MQSFVGELKRRNVFRVGVLYVVVGWLVIQVADITIPALGIPRWAVSLVVVLVALGLPIALLLAWAFELTPEGVKRTHEVDRGTSITHVTGRKLDFVIIGVLAAALGLVVLDAYVLEDRATPAARALAEETPADASIAVLPFVNMSPDKDQEYFTDGISEELLNALAREEGFRVAGRTSSFAFKGKNDDLRVIGAKLRVANVLEGSVRKQGDRIRITAQLVKVANGYHLWSDTYDRQLDDVFAIQSEIATEVARALKKTLLREADESPPASSARIEVTPTRNVDAYSHYLRGQHLLRTRRAEDMRAGLAEFERAVEIDPQFAKAHAAIAVAHALLVDQSAGRSVEDLRASTAAAERALQIEPELPEALGAKTLVLELQGAPHAERIALLERALRSSPRDPQLLMWLASDYEEVLRIEEGMRAMRRAYEIDPLAPVLLSNYAQSSYQRGDHALAERLVRELDAISTNKWLVYDLRGNLAQLRDDYPDRIRWGVRAVEAAPGNGRVYRHVVFGYRELGDYAKARRYAERALSFAPDDSRAVTWKLRVLLESGERQAAERGLAEAWSRLGPQPGLALVKAELALGRADAKEALDAIHQGVPSIMRDKPSFAWGAPIFVAPWAVLALRRSGAENESQRLASAADSWILGYWDSEGVPIRGDPLVMRARIAAARGDRSAVIEQLRAIDAYGGTVPAHLSNETLFAAFARDAEIAPLLARFDARRAEIRGQLAKEGL